MTPNLSLLSDTSETVPAAAALVSMAQPSLGVNFMLANILL